MQDELEQELPLGVRMFRENFPKRFPKPDSISKCDKCDTMLTVKTVNIAIDNDVPYCTTYALCGRCFTLFKINKTQSQ